MLCLVHDDFRERVFSFLDPEPGFAVHKSFDVAVADDSETLSYGSEDGWHCGTVEEVYKITFFGIWMRPAESETVCDHERHLFLEEIGYCKENVLEVQHR